jgi:hypothetical protein
MRSLSLVSLLALVAAGCSGNHDPVLPTGQNAIVTTSGGFGAGGAVNAVRIDSKAVTKALDTTVDQDNQVRVFDGKAYVLNRTPGTLFVYDTGKWTAPVEIATGDATADHSLSNPNDVVVLPGSTRAYVSLYGNDAAHAIGVVDLAQPQAGVIKWVNVPASATDADGHPEPGTLYACQGKIYALLADLNAATYAPTGPGRIAVIDPATDTTTGFIALTGQNPGSISAEDADCRHVLVATSGPFGLEPDKTAAIERVDLEQQKSGVVLADVQLKGRPSSVQVISSTFAIAAIYYDLEPQPMGPPLLSSAKVIAFDPSQPKVLCDLTSAAAYIPFATASADGQIWIGVDNYAGSLSDGKLGSGLYVGSADCTTKLTALDLGQNPYAIAFE